MRTASLLFLVLAAACGDDDGGPLPGSDLPESWTLAAGGITVEIARSPYGVTVLDGAGTPVLESVGDARGDGWAPLAWTSGTIGWRTGGLTKGHYTFVPQLDPWREGWLVVEARERADGLELVLRENGRGEARLVVDHTIAASRLRVEARLEGADAPRAMSAAFGTPPDEAFLGFGERFNRTDQRGVSVFAWAEEGGVGTGEDDLVGPTNPTPNGEAMTYYPVPFFVSTRGYGFWLDSTWRNTFDLATDHDDAWRVWHIGPSLAYEVYVPIPDDERPWPYHLVDLFTERTGRPMIPAPWIFGPRRRIGRNSTALGVPEIQAMRDQDLAITAVDDAMHFLPEGSHVGKEDELRAWVADATRLGYRVNGYYNSLLADTPDSPIRAEVDRGIANDWFLLDERGEPDVVELISGEFLPVLQVDFTSDEATAWFQSLFEWALDLGYSGWMYDFGEYVQPKSVASNGMTGEELHNLYPVLYDRAVHEHMEAGPHAGDWLAFARAGYTGSSQWVPVVWSGDPAASFEDSDGLPSMVRAAINVGISGAPHWGGDIGGFHCAADGAAAADGELLARWIQQGSMTSAMMDQNACFFATDMGEKATIWTAPEALEAWRVYGRLHTRLFPYFWALAHEAHATGAPVVRHVFFEHPDRVDLAGVDDAHYLGRAILVAPVVDRGAREKSVALPDGRWVDWRDGALYEGGREVTLAAPLDSMPLLLREGHLVPLLDPTIDTLAEEDDPAIVGPADVADVYDVVGVLSPASGAARFELADGGSLVASVDGAFASPAGMPEAASEAELAACTPGCWLVADLGGGVTRVRLTHDGGALDAGGLHVASDTGRRARWDLYLVE